ncbi:MAG: glycine cleavage system aminomethyltransferase GcvT [Ideonella sp.]|nr:glycine cleavage system aminomethyltransferase GcvT [Ideonella sp.]
MTDTATPASDLQRTPLHALHLELGARMVGFAGYDMPVSYPEGVLAEHRHCRTAAALFDVSHMGQVRLLGADADRALESLVPVDVIGLGMNRQRYGFFTNSAGGILDDLMITRRAIGKDSDLLLVVNAGCKAADIAHLTTNIGHRCTVQPLPEQALLALQGPKAVAALGRLAPGVAALTFMTGGAFALAGAECYVTRSGYTGEDGFEISVPAAQAEALARTLLAQRDVKPAGLGARDTLRLEAGLCLYGHDIDTRVSPVHAGLTWAIQKVRRAGGERAGGYPGAQTIDHQMVAGVPHKRVGLVGLERVPVREGAQLFDTQGRRIGLVTSGTLGPTFGKPIAMAYLASNHALPHHEVQAEVRGQKVPMRVHAMPFTPHRYHRG